MYDPNLFDLEQHRLPQIIGVTCQAELIHETAAVLSFLPLAAVPFLGAFPVFFFTSLISANLDLYFAAAQRYNRPRLLRLLERRQLENRGI